jgi:hypothetical protein
MPIRKNWLTIKLHPFIMVTIFIDKLSIQFKHKGSCHCGVEADGNCEIVELRDNSMTTISPPD